MSVGDSIKHAIMICPKFSVTETSDTGAMRSWLMGRFRNKVKDLSLAIQKGAEELATAGLVHLVECGAKKKGRKVLSYRKASWGELSEPAKEAAEKLHIPRCAFE